nr:polysaccharide biosynthesis C-terminal domain-containing protein [Lachnoclostridium phocaeense]
MRKKKLALNTTFSFLSEILTILSGFVVPQLILRYYGSDVNGLISSITYFLSLISLCQVGIGPVIQANLYKPLVEHNQSELSKIMKSANNFFRTIAIILVFYTLGLTVFYPLLINGKFGHLYTASLILILSIETFSRYYFGIANRLLLTADQKSYIYLLFSSLAILFNMLACSFLIRMGLPVHVVKLATAFFYTVLPIQLALYVKHNYKIDRKITYESEPIKQKWNGFAQHVATIVQDNTDIIVLTAFSSLENVSIYSVYHMVTNGIKTAIVTINSGVTSLMGDMIARKEINKLNKAFDFYEWLFHTLSTLLYTVAGNLILNFVSLYTKNVDDVNYILPGFAILMVSCGALRCIGLVYSTIVNAAGHFRQTQIGVFVEPMINISISVLSVFKFGLIGITLGTLVSLIYRLIFFTWYLSRNIMYRPMSIFIRHIFIDIIIALTITVISISIPLSIHDYLGWILQAIIVSTISVVVVTIINVLFNRERLKESMKLIKKRRNQK